MDLDLGMVRFHHGHHLQNPIALCATCTHKWEDHTGAVTLQALGPGWDPACGSNDSVWMCYLHARRKRTGIGS